MNKLVLNILTNQRKDVTFQPIRRKAKINHMTFPTLAKPSPSIFDQIASLQETRYLMSWETLAKIKKNQNKTKNWTAHYNFESPEEIVTKSRFEPGPNSVTRVTGSAGLTVVKKNMFLDIHRQLHTKCRYIFYGLR